jgi:NitT/TauT family transport system permease protein
MVHESAQRAHRERTVADEPAERPPRPPFWTIRGQLDRRLYLAIAAGSFVVWIAAWWAATAASLVDPLFLPGPMAVVRRFGVWAFDGDLANDTGISIYRVLAGFLISVVTALPLGLYIGAYRPVRAFFEPLMEFARYLPAVAFVPVVLLWAGIGESSKITVIWIGTFFQLVIMISEDIGRVPMAQIEAAKTLGATNGEVVKFVLIRSAMPAIFDTFRVTLGWAWTYLVVAELVAANSGLGYAILKAQRFLQTDRIFVGVAVIGLIGLATDQALRLMHRKLFPWVGARS